MRRAEQGALGHLPEGEGALRRSILEKKTAFALSENAASTSQLPRRRSLRTLRERGSEPT